MRRITDIIKKHPLPFILILFAILTVIYYRYVIFSPSDMQLTKHLATDIYGHYLHVFERLKLLGQGFLSLGDYWVDRGGGFPSASNEQLLIPQELCLMLFYTITGSFSTAIKCIEPLFLFLTLVTAYYYGTIIFKRKDAGLVLAVSYGFSMYAINQAEHIDLVGIQPLVLLSLIFMEKMFVKPKAIYIIAQSVLWFTIYMSNLYALYFLGIYLLMRLIFQWKLIDIGNIAKVCVMFVFLALPFIILQLDMAPNQSIKDIYGQYLMNLSRPPGFYLWRNNFYLPYTTEVYWMYIGIFVVMLAMLPIILQYKGILRKLYIFNLVVTVFCLLYSIGYYSPVNIAMLIHKYAPFAYFIRVPGRIMMIGYLTFSICAVIGYIIIVNKYYRKRFWITAILLALIFCDLTIGFEPKTMPVVFQPNNSSEYIKEQEGDFRYVEIPSVHDQQAMTIMNTGHDTLNPIVWAFGFFEPLNRFARVYHRYLECNISAEEASFYGVKYVSFNTNQEYYETFKMSLIAISSPDYESIEKAEEKVSSDDNYELVFSDDGVNIYRNKLYKGLVFSDYENCLVDYERIDNNTLIIDVETDKETKITISQSYADGWIATWVKYGQTITRAVSDNNYLQSIIVPEGKTHITLEYAKYNIWWRYLIICWGAFILAIVGVLLIRRINKVG